MLEQVRAYRRVDDHDAAWKQLREAYKTCPSDHYHLLGRLQAMEGQLLRDEGQLQKAIILYQKALMRFQVDNNPLKEAHTLRHLGEMEDELGHLDIAQNYFEQCQSIYADLPQALPMDLANYYRAYALFLEKGHSLKSRVNSFWEKARDIYSMHGIEEGVRECDEQLNK